MEMYTIIGIMVIVILGMIFTWTLLWALISAYSDESKTIAFVITLIISAFTISILFYSNNKRYMPEYNNKPPVIITERK